MCVEEVGVDGFEILNPKGRLLIDMADLMFGGESEAKHETRMLSTYT